MSMGVLNQAIIPLYCFFLIISIFGIGLFFNNIFSIYKIELDLKNLIFIQGLFFSSIIFVFINFFTPITDILSLLVILIGSIIYFFYFFKITQKKKEIKFIFLIIVFSFILIYYAGVSDDFDYHYKIIKNYKNNSLFDILHHRRASYNSYWLFITSLFSINFFTSTLFVLTSIFFSISIYDFFKLTRTSIKKNEYYVSTISFFLLIFFLGNFSKLKDFGTDIPGVILGAYMYIIVINHLFEKKNKTTNEIFLLILFLFQFSFIIKITNGLLIILILLIIYNLNLKKINYVNVFFTLLIPIPWFYQNFIISNCLIWPISITCFENVDHAKSEAYLVEAFAKGDLNTSIDVNNLSWIKIWLANHFNKLVETYLLYILLLIIPIIYCFSKKEFIFIKLINHLKIFLLNKNYLILLILILITNIIWFIYIPAYRFGFNYNLYLLIVVILPFWLFNIKSNHSFIIEYSKYLLIVISLYFIVENINKINWYKERYIQWPPIIDGELINRKNF